MTNCFDCLEPIKESEKCKDCENDFCEICIREHKHFVPGKTLRVLEGGKKSARLFKASGGS